MRLSSATFLSFGLFAEISGSKFKLFKRKLNGSYSEDYKIIRISEYSSRNRTRQPQSERADPTKHEQSKLPKLDGTTVPTLDGTKSPKASGTTSGTKSPKGGVKDTQMPQNPPRERTLNVRREKAVKKVT